MGFVGQNAKTEPPVHVCRLPPPGFFWNRWPVGTLYDCDDCGNRDEKETRRIWALGAYRNKEPEAQIGCQSATPVELREDS